MLLWIAVAVLRAGLQTTSAVDNDVKAALDALIRTYRTLQTGLYYQSRPDNMVAAVVMDQIQESVDEIRKRLAEQSGMHNIRDVDLLGVFAFLQRLEIQHNNGRRLGRAFINWLQDSFGKPSEAAVAPPEEAPSIIL